MIRISRFFIAATISISPLFVSAGILQDIKRIYGATDMVLPLRTDVVIGNAITGAEVYKDRSSQLTILKNGQSCGSNKSGYKMHGATIDSNLELTSADRRDLKILFSSALPESLLNSSHTFSYEVSNVEFFVAPANKLARSYEETMKNCTSSNLRLIRTVTKGNLSLNLVSDRPYTEQELSLVRTRLGKLFEVATLASSRVLSLKTKKPIVVGVISEKNRSF